MVDTTEPKTLVKSGIFNGDLGEALLRFNQEIVKAPSIIPGFDQYCLCERTEEGVYLLATGKATDKEIWGQDNQVMLSVTSRSLELNDKLARNFQDATGINLNEPISERVRDHFKLYSQIFLRFEYHPERAMESLMRLSR